MTTTSVGMRCPECAKQRTKVKTGTAAFGRAGATPATTVLIVINVVAFLAEIGTGSGGFNTDAARANFGIYAPAIANGDWYRIVTSGFLHVSIFHIAFNMYALYILGRLLETAFGSVRFVAMYAASLLAGSLGVILLEPNSFAVGASGAIFGLFTAALVIARGRRLDAIAAQLGFLLVINFVFTFTYPGIAIGAHLFGAGAGVLCGLLILAGDREILGPNRVPIEVAAMSLLGIVAAVASVALA
jgi:membrane associated rhomboid family serine protease